MFTLNINTKQIKPKHNDKHKTKPKHNDKS